MPVKVRILPSAVTEEGTKGHRDVGTKEECMTVICPTRPLGGAPAMRDQSETSSWCNVSTPPCHGGGVGSNPSGDLTLTWLNGSSARLLIGRMWVRVPPRQVIGWRSPRRPVKPLSQNKWSGRRVVRFLRYPCAPHRWFMRRREENE